MPNPLRMLSRRKQARKDALAQAWRDVAYVSDASPIIVGGCPRSGTTLVRVILDTHSNICCGPETEIFKPGRRNPTRLAGLLDLPAGRVEKLLEEADSQAQFIDELFAAYAHASGKPRWAEKTPNNIQSLDFIFDRFPRARFIHALRDGRDTICSLRTHPRHKVVDGELVPLNTNNPIDQCIETWVTEVQRGTVHRGDDRYYELRYEDLILNPEPTLRSLFDWLEEPWEPGVLNFHEVKSGSRDVKKFPQNPEATQKMSDKSLGRWREHLTDDEVAMFMERAGDLARDLGYLDEAE